MSHFKFIATLIFSAIALLTSGGALAQEQNIDEPRLDPIFGRRPAQPPAEIGPMNDDEFDNERRWSPFKGFIGAITLLVPDTTNLSLGVGPQFQPDYFGSNDYEVQADPQVFIKVRNFTFLDDDGADLALFGFSGFAFGPSIRLLGDRDEVENPDLAGLGNISETLEVGGFVATRFLDRILVRVKARQGVTGGHDGLIIDGAGTILLFTTPRFSAAFTGQVTWIDNNLADTFFSVTDEQSANSGLPVFDADSGFRDVGGSVNGYINLGKRWSLNPYVRYSRIFEGIADTPIISQLGSRDQFIAGFHIMREFRFDFFD
ncbi:MAG: MipA/OmpV family protein [Pseudomonadota bacterium]